MTTSNATIPIRMTDNNNVRQLAPVLPSKFELLPLEIRQHIYGYLGFPIARTIWLSYWDILSCAAFASAAENANRVNRDGMVQLTAIKFLRAVARKQDVIVRGIDLRTGITRVTKGCEARHCYLECNYCVRQQSWTVETGMMRVNRRIYSELCDLLFSGISVEFDFELSDRKVHYIEDEWHEVGKRFWGGDSHTGYVPIYRYWQN